MNLPKNLQEVPWIKVGFGIAGIIIFAVLSSIIWAAAAGAAGALVLGGLGMLGIAMIKSMSYFGQKLDNKLLSLRKEEARENPIEQLQNEALRRENVLAQESDALTSMGTSIRSMSDMLQLQQRNDPGIDLSQEWEDHAAMEEDFVERKAIYAEAIAELEEYKKYIERRAFKYKYAQASEKTRASMVRNAKEEATQALLVDEADIAVQDRYNASFARMEVARAKREGNRLSKQSAQQPKQLENKPETIDVVSRTLLSQNQTVHKG